MRKKLRSFFELLGFSITTFFKSVFDDIGALLYAILVILFNFIILYINPNGFIGMLIVTIGINTILPIIYTVIYDHIQTIKTSQSIHRIQKQVDIINQKLDALNSRKPTEEEKYQKICFNTSLYELDRNQNKMIQILFSYASFTLPCMIISSQTVKQLTLYASIHDHITSLTMEDSFFATFVLNILIFIISLCIFSVLLIVSLFFMIPETKRLNALIKNRRKLCSIQKPIKKEVLEMIVHKKLSEKERKEIEPLFLANDEIKDHLIYLWDDENSI